MDGDALSTQAAAAPAASASKPSATERVAARLVQQLDKWLDGHRASGDAFVASLYGEWGVGKTYCLKVVAKAYRDRLDAELQRAGSGEVQLVIPVWFDPWRYEHEEHLVVPMLKTIELTLRKLDDKIAAMTEDEAGAAAPTSGAHRAVTLLQEGAIVAGRLAQALLSAVKFKVAPLGVGFEIEPKAAIDKSLAFADAAAAAKGDADPVRPRFMADSIYFNAQTELESVTTRREGVTLRLVVLIDDLDRCLPEKAVQVLESVKLFLNVRGFSFVLAVDDEVVERGIAYRYRDYRPVDRDGAASGTPPISGAQYLEKIVHLPVHLPRWTADAARAFLLDEYAHFYAVPDADRGTADTSGREHKGPRDVTIPAGTRATVAKSASSENAAALELVLKAVPLVPRKLIRLSEAVEYLQGQFAEQGQMAHWSLLHAIRVISLQQMYPVLYRHLRQRPARYWRLFLLVRDEWHEPRYRDGQTLAALSADFSSRRAAPPAANATAAAASASQSDTVREQLDLLNLVHDSGNQRGAGDPIALFAYDTAPLGERGAVPAGLEYQSFADLYFGGEAPPSPKTVVVTPEPAAQPEAQLTNLASAVAALMNPDAISRREFIESQGLVGKRLPAEAAAALLDGIAAAGDGIAARALDLDWLRDLAKVTSADQLLAVYDKAQVIKRHLEALAPVETST